DGPLSIGSAYPVIDTGVELNRSCSFSTHASAGLAFAVVALAWKTWRSRASNLLPKLDPQISILVRSGKRVYSTPRLTGEQRLLLKRQRLQVRVAILVDSSR